MNYNHHSTRYDDLPLAVKCRFLHPGSRARMQQTTRTTTSDQTRMGLTTSHDHHCQQAVSKTDPALGSHNTTVEQSNPHGNENSQQPLLLINHKQNKPYTGYS